MKKTEIKSFNKWILPALVGLCSIAVFVAGIASFRAMDAGQGATEYKYPDSKFGAFLGAQHAIYVNDFDSAAEFSTKLQDVDAPIVKHTNALAAFLSGNIDDSAKIFKNDDTISGKLVYTSYLITQDDWKTIYKIFEKNNSAFLAPIRIWSGVGINYITKTMQFVDTLPANDSWKAFIKGQIYVEVGKIDKAAEQFALVSADFMNINDYLYLMAFYESNGMEADADLLHDEFTHSPGGIFMLNMPTNHDFAPYTGIKNALAFSLIQTVSHSQAFGGTDLALALLRMAGVASNQNPDVLNYYLGIYFYNSGGDYDKYFKQIPRDSLFYPFVHMKYSETAETMRKAADMMQDLLDENPLFLPAINSLIAKKMQYGEYRDAARILNNSLAQKNLPAIGRAFLLRARARVEIARGDMEAAQRDIRDAAAILPADSGIIAEQAKIWALTGRNLDDAYQYAMALINRFPGDIEAWDTLGLVVWKKEGAKQAIDIISRVADVAASNSSLFEHLGDMYVEVGEKVRASAAYRRALDLSDDGLVSEESVKRKLRKME